jgi:hypothetical protein
MGCNVLMAKRISVRHYLWAAAIIVLLAPTGSHAYVVSNDYCDQALPAANAKADVVVKHFWAAPARLPTTGFVLELQQIRRVYARCLGGDDQKRAMKDIDGAIWLMQYMDSIKAHSKSPSTK